MTPCVQRRPGPRSWCGGRARRARWPPEIRRFMTLSAAAIAASGFLVPHRPATSSGRAREVVMELSESLAQFGMTEREPGTLVVACVHNFVVLEYRINAGLLWSRVLLPDGSEFLDGVSDWEALQLEEVLSLMRAKPPDR